MPENALINEKSPYLRQHAHNPVQWLPWGEVAFEKARNEQKPIFLSVGYSTCHWCHVMAHESFEDAGVAEILNRYFVPVKVDREERPDVDRIYMLFVQAFTGAGGWPMSVWMTPDLQPFYGGTYFPRNSQYGRPGFQDVLSHLAKAWKEDRARMQESSLNVTEQLRALTSASKAALEPDEGLFEAAFWQFRRTFDRQWGGFGQAPKFPRPVVLNYLLRYYATKQSNEALDMVLATLRSMASGGMYDHLGGGFHRYSVDERWFVPHFEKMLYDQAQLAIAYLEAYQITREERFSNVAREIFTYVQRDLTDPEGGFYSAEDADSPDPENPKHGGEGAFYIWRKSEIEALLGEAAPDFCAHYGVKAEGNVDQDPHGEFLGRNILDEANRSASPTDNSVAIAGAKRRLFEAREKRPRPHLDRKILTSWNGLMISALARGAIVLNDSRCLEMARAAAAFVLRRMFDSASGNLLRRYCEGEAAVSGFLDDYAFFAQGLLDLFEASSDVIYLETAIRLATVGLSRFEDPAGGFFSTVAGQGDLLLRMKEDYDGAEPSGNSVAAEVLLRLAHLTGNQDFQSRAQLCLRAFASALKAQPTMAPQMLVAVGGRLAPPEQYVIRCATLDQRAQDFLDEARRPFKPYATVLAVSDVASEKLRGIAPFLGGLERQGNVTLYECRDFRCDLPKVIR